MTHAVTEATDKTALAGPGDYFQLLKPRVLSLVVFTALTGLVCAPGAVHPVLAAVAVLCIAVGAGAAGALNMAIEGKTDALMRRTRGRPVAAGRVSKNDALVFGGAAGAFPPVIGWAAATGTLSLDAWLMFLIIFLWTPPHSWALALYTTEDYAKAGIPMMPVARGAKSTRLQILLYSLVMVPVAVAPVFTGLGGMLYAGISFFGGLVFFVLVFCFWRSCAGDRPE